MIKNLFFVIFSLFSFEACAFDVPHKELPEPKEVGSEFLSSLGLAIEFVRVDEGLLQMRMRASEGLYRHVGKEKVKLSYAVTEPDTDDVVLIEDLWIPMCGGYLDKIVSVKYKQRIGIVIKSDANNLESGVYYYRIKSQGLKNQLGQSHLIPLSSIGFSCPDTE